ncbi:MAG: UDP-N-acetylmuramoyl-tripeptide--D-alanyl-D-alanine ligase [Candidatus Geothermincolales bacterium]
MIPMRLEDIARSVKGRLLSGDKEMVITAISTDTRTLRGGELFVALRGRRYDAHDFLGQALDKGARALAVSRVDERLLERARSEGVGLIRVGNTATALLRLARAQREKGRYRVAGITGSSGKTLTKDFLYSIMKRTGRAVASPASYNNEVGMPLTVLAADEATEYLILEMGARGKGHVEGLCRYARPEVGIITNIGWAHLRYFGSRKGIAEAKSELVASLPPDGLAVLPRDDEFWEYLVKRSSAPVISFGLSRKAQVRAEKIVADEKGRPSFLLVVEGKEVARIDLPLPGMHLVTNALAACAAALHWGAGVSHIVEGLEDAEVSEGRMEMIETRSDVTVINDAYNANPASMRSALETFAALAGERRAIAVLGDMAELGRFSEEAHREVGRLAVECGTDILIAVGRRARSIARAALEAGLPRGSVFAVRTTEQAAEVLRAILEPGDVVLVKGSNFLGLHRLPAMVA